MGFVKGGQLASSPPFDFWESGGPREQSGFLNQQFAQKNKSAAFGKFHSAPKDSGFTEVPLGVAVRKICHRKLPPA
jgi:hypothetical protein